MNLFGIVLPAVLLTIFAAACKSPRESAVFLVPTMSQKGLARAEQPGGGSLVVEVIFATDTSHRSFLEVRKESPLFQLEIDGDFVRIEAASRRSWKGSIQNVPAPMKIWVAGLLAWRGATAGSAGGAEIHCPMYLVRYEREDTQIRKMVVVSSDTGERLSVRFDADRM